MGKGGGSAPKRHKIPKLNEVRPLGMLQGLPNSPVKKYTPPRYETRYKWENYSDGEIPRYPGYNRSGATRSGWNVRHKYGRRKVPYKVLVSGDPGPKPRPGPALPDFIEAPDIPEYGMVRLGAAPTIDYNPVIDAPDAPIDIRELVNERDEALEQWGMRLLEPQFEQARDAMHTRLVNQGLMPGSEGFDRAVREVSTAEGDALARLMLQGREAERQLAYAQAQQNQEVGRWGLAADTREAELRLQKALEEAGFIQERDLAEGQWQHERYGDIFDAQRSRDMANWGMGYTHRMTPYHAQLDRDLAMLDSETARHVANLSARGGAAAAAARGAAQGRSSMLGGLFGLGSTIISGAFGLSDPRFKRNAVVVGKGHKGLPIYEYQIGNRTERGYFADEVLEVEPDAVVHGPGGYMMLNYALLGGKPHA